MTTVFKNGKIYTMNREQPYVTALVVEDDRIVYVGYEEGAKAYESKGRVVDLRGRMMIPGMIDAHCHPMQYPFLTSGMVLDVTLDRQGVLDAIAEYVEQNPDLPRYFGIGYPEWVFDERGPLKEDLDKICAGKPIYLMSSGIHEGWGNSKTFELAGVTRDTKDVIPGFSYFQRNADGTPSGRVVEIPSEMVILKGIPWFSEERIEEGYREMFDECASLGITGFVDCGNLEAFEPISERLMEGFEAGGELKQRFDGCVMVEDQTALAAAVAKLKEKRKRFHSDLYDIRTLKIVNDGTVESLSAATDEPFFDGTLVEPMAQGQKFYDACVEAAKEGFDIHIHGIGDKAVHENLMAARAVREAGYYDVRFINAHTQLVRAEDLALFGKYNVIANFSSIWFYQAPDVTRILGEARVNRQYQPGTIARLGGRVTLGSDMPADELGHEPLKGIQMAVTRRLYLDPESPPLPEKLETMTVHQALAAYTVNAAYAMGLEDRTGSLTAGKYADLVVLDRDIHEIDPEEIISTQVLLTVMGGRVTYRNEAFREEV